MANIQAENKIPQTSFLETKLKNALEWTNYLVETISKEHIKLLIHKEILSNP